jgi:hypothetical protein
MDSVPERVPPQVGLEIEPAVTSGLVTQHRSASLLQVITTNLEEAA